MKLLNIKIFLSYLLILISLVTCELTGISPIPEYRCGIDTSIPIKITDKNIFDFNTENLNSNNVDEDGYKEFNIHLDLTSFEEEADEYNIQDEKRNLFIDGMNKAINTLKSLLRVKPPNKNWGFYDEQLKEININNWDNNVIGNGTKGMIDSNIDLFIFAKFFNKSDEIGIDNSILAKAGAKYVQADGRPLVGVVVINGEINYSKEKSSQYLEAIILHEFTHILGFHYHFFTNYFHNVITEGESENQRYYINSSKVVQVGKKYFNCDSLNRVALENNGVVGNGGSHWDARILLGDYMNGVVFTSEQVISEFTLALLEDTEYYKANYYTGGLMQFGKNKGCEFIKNKCIDNESLNPKYTNEFFTKIYNENYDTSCSSNRQSRTYHTFYQYSSDLPENYRYYSENSKLGGWPSAKYCPVSTEDSEGTSKYYVGHCSSVKGSEEYGSHIIYNINDENKSYKSSEIKDIIGESLSENSFCVLSSLILKTKENSEQYSQTFRAVCYQMHCSNTSLTIQINNDYIVCPRAGGKINATNYNGYLLCPDYYLICSGSKLCNDMFDCVEKKSLLNDDIYYDYESKTTQDLGVIEEDELSDDAYELSTGGICPMNCSECSGLSFCTRCKNNSEIVEITENSQTKRECVTNEEIDNGGYYQKENELIYHKCLENCKECTNDTKCITCKEGYYNNKNIKCFLNIDNCQEYNDDTGKCKVCESGFAVADNGNNCQFGSNYCLKVVNDTCLECEQDYRLEYGHCYKKVEHCQSYQNESDNCEQCESGYAFEDNDRLNCKEETQFQEYYYTKDNGTSYFRCEFSNEEYIEGCNRCNYTDNQLICKECKDNYVFKDEQINFCYLNETFENESQKYYYSDPHHIRTCSKAIENCEECGIINNNLLCSKCDNESYFVNEDYSQCVLLDDINPIEEYFIYNNDTFRACKIYSIVENCKTCNDSSSCNLCLDGYAFITETKDQCKNISELENRYIPDEFDPTLYKKCSTFFSNCDTCHSQFECDTCESNYVLFNDKISCIAPNDKRFYINSTDHLYYRCSDNIDNCEECENESKCIKCTEDYALSNDKCYFKIDNCTEYKTNGQCQECENGYKVNKVNENVTECIFEVEHCTKLDANGECIDCENGYRPINNNCYQGIENCSRYEDNSEKCAECYEGFAFDEDDRLNCIGLDYFVEYYTKDNKVYYKCDSNKGETKIDNCKKCNYTNSQLICNECRENYTLKDDETNKCYTQKEFENNKSLYYDNPLHIQLCSKGIDNCDECEKIDNDLKCTKCKNGYYFIDENYNECKNLTNINLKEYFEKDGEYYSCLRYHSIKNCLNCSNSISCDLCLDGFTFISTAKNECIDIFQLGNEYIPDSDDYTLYSKCSKFIKNCKECLSENECIACEKDLGYGLYKDKTQCVELKDKKYYTDDYGFSYRPCNDSLIGCVKCEDQATCLECISGGEYFLQNNKCLRKIDKCKTYNDDGECNECNKGYKPNEDKDGCTIEVDHCSEVDSNGICSDCDTNYRISNGMCYEIIDKCQTYEENSANCKQCVSEYAFEGNNRLACKNILNDFGEYYTKDNGISYFKCSGQDDPTIQYCAKCDYNNGKLLCNKCQENFLYKEDEKSQCYSREQIRYDKKYYYNSTEPSYVKLCSKKINNCEECEAITDNDIKCIKCENEYYFVDEDYYHCKKQEDVGPADEYFLDNNNYYSCINYNSIQNCKKCNNKNNCNLCKEGYTFIDDKKSSCYNIEELGDKYVPDSNDTQIYRKCGYYMENCDTCSSQNICKSCISPYGLYNDKKTCIDNSGHDYIEDPNEHLYYVCNISIANCEKCSAYNACNKCKDKYVRVNNDNSKCQALSSISDEEYYQDTHDNNMYIQCSNFVENCLKCNYPNGCTLCNSGFILTNGNYKKCSDKSTIDLSHYYTKDQAMYYSCDIQQFKNDVSCFLFEDSREDITLTFLQIQKIENKLYVYMMTHSPLPKNIQIKLKVLVYSTTKTRNLDTSEERDFTFITSDESDGTLNKKITFVSEEELNDGEDIVNNAKMEDMQFNTDDTLTKTITEKNNCKLIYNIDTEWADTGKASSLIGENQIVDLSNPKAGLISLTADKVDGCVFDLKSDSPASYSNDYLELELVPEGDTENKIKAKCNTKNKRTTSIECSLEEEADSSYSFKDEIIYDPNNYITIDNKKQYKINCKNTDKKDSRILMIIIIICACALVIIIVIIIAIIRKKKSKKDGISRMATTENVFKEKVKYYNRNLDKIKAKEFDQKKPGAGTKTLKENIKKAHNKYNRNNQQEIYLNTKRKLKDRIEE